MKRDAESFGERLKRLRTEKAIPVTMLASAAGVTEGAVRQLESGRIKTPGFDIGVLLADTLGVDARYLAFGEDRRACGPMARRVANVERRVTLIEERLGMAAFEAGA